MHGSSIQMHVLLQHALFVKTNIYKVARFLSLLILMKHAWMQNEVGVKLCFKLPIAQETQPWIKRNTKTRNRSNTSDTSKPSKSSNRKVNLWQVWTWETIRNKCLCHLRVIEVHLLQYFKWLEEIYWVLPAMALYLRLTSDGFVLVSYLTYPSYTWVLLGFFWPDEQSYSRGFLLMAPWAVSLDCNRFLFEHVLLVSFFFRISQIKLTYSVFPGFKTKSC